MASSISLVLRRSLSTGRPYQSMIKTPVPTFGIAGTYTQALYSASVKNKTKDIVAKDLINFGEVLKNPKVSDYINDPFVGSSDKLSLLKEVGGKTGMADTTINLFGTLAENHRLNLVSEVSHIFARLMKAEKGEVPATVTTAQPLDTKQRKDVEAALAKFVNKNEKIELVEKVDPTILGGMIVDIGDKYTDMKYIDMSTASKIKIYQDLLRQPV
ncbi:ATP synthase subunit O, mitochondrial-like [Clavelina lepadiformis]|uniref:ATP synthase subunit O, mitochondrial-like n=1 Tax=Clavelina lepadiformis TaxID=159417 RepID=UPI004042BAC4